MAETEELKKKKQSNKINKTRILPSGFRRKDELVR